MLLACYQACEVLHGRVALEASTSFSWWPHRLLLNIGGTQGKVHAHTQWIERVCLETVTWEVLPNLCKVPWTHRFRKEHWNWFQKSRSIKNPAKTKQHEGVKGSWVSVVITTNSLKTIQRLWNRSTSSLPPIRGWESRPKLPWTLRNTTTQRIPLVIERRLLVRQGSTP